jgi:hypothetical protein
MSRPRLGVIGAGPDQVPLIECALRLGCDVVTIDASAARIGHLLSTLPPIIVDLADPDNLLAEISHRALDGLVSMGSEIGLQALAYCTARLGLPNGIPALALNTSRDKRLQREILRKLEAPLLRRIYRERNTRGFPVEVDHWDCRKVAVKPIDRWGSLGTTMVIVKDEKIDHRAAIFDKAFNWAFSCSDSSQIIVEEFAYGQEFGINARISSGQVQSIAANRRIVETGDWRPIGCFPMYFKRSSEKFLDIPTWLAHLIDIITSIIAILAVDWSGILNADVIVRDGVPYMLEFSFRGGGFGTTLLYDLFFDAGQTEALINDAFYNSKFSDYIQHNTMTSRDVYDPRMRPISLSLSSRAVAGLLASLPRRRVETSSLTIRSVYLQNSAEHGEIEHVTLRRRSRGAGLAIIEVGSHVPYDQLLPLFNEPTD